MERKCEESIEYDCPFWVKGCEEISQKVNVYERTQNPRSRTGFEASASWAFETATHKCWKNIDGIIHECQIKDFVPKGKCEQGREHNCPYAKSKECEESGGNLEICGINLDALSRVMSRSLIKDSNKMWGSTKEIYACTPGGDPILKEVIEIK